MAGIHAIIVANLMSEAIAPHMGRPVTNAKVLIISKPFVIPRLQQPRQGRVHTEARSHSRRDMHLLGATVARAKELANVNTRRRRRLRTHQSRKRMK